jgi:hypothetical protein
VEDPWSLLPPIDMSVLDWDEDADVDAKAETVEDAPEEKAVHVTEETIEKLEKEKWSGVNGCYDVHADWKNWNQCVALSSYNGDDFHVLPYVDIDG